jgi:ResB-like family
VSALRSASLPLIRFLSSFGLATVLLILLLVITFLGTLEQVEHGLYDSQSKYFDSAFIWNIDVGACLRALSINAKDWVLPVLLPGGYLVMALFGLNIVVGGLIRIRKSPRTIGVVIAHFSMVFMLLAGAVSFHFKEEGNMALFEGQTSNEFQSFHDRVVEIEEIAADPKAKRSALVIPMAHFEDLEPSTTGKARSFSAAGLPFELTLMNYQVNSEPKRAQGDETRDVVDGYFLQPLPKKPTAEQNLDGIYANVKDKSGAVQKGILWGAQAAPWTVKVDGRTFLIDLTRRRWQLPFAVKLDRFDRELHPGTERARKFTSHVTKIVGEHEEKKIITMNEPVRDSGYVLFQASFSMDQNGGAPVKQSVFAVSQNPSDHWPLISCVMVAIGLLIHFGNMLRNYIKRA